MTVVADFTEDFVLLSTQNKNKFSNYVNHAEAGDYSGCGYTFGGSSYIQRTAKQTPKKVGQFVTLWKRAKSGETEPFSSSDELDFVVIICKQGESLGHFLFPKDILGENGILSSPKAGKRGFRVYPPWDEPESKQALRTQKWQTKHFVDHLKLKS